VSWIWFLQKFLKISVAFLAMKQEEGAENADLESPNVTRACMAQRTEKNCSAAETGCKDHVQHFLACFRHHRHRPTQHRLTLVKRQFPNLNCFVVRYHRLGKRRESGQSEPAPSSAWPLCRMDDGVFVCVCVCEQTTLFHCPPIPWLTMVLSYVITNVGFRV
jgi:hypothetical protein